MSEGKGSSPTLVPTVDAATFSDLKRLTSHRECRYKFAPALQYKAARVSTDRLNCRPYDYSLQQLLWYSSALDVGPGPGEWYQ